MSKLLPKNNLFQSTWVDLLQTAAVTMFKVRVIVAISKVIELSIESNRKVNILLSQVMSTRTIDSANA